MKKIKVISYTNTSEELFKIISTLINQSKKNVAQAVNRELTLLYWQVGKEISGRILKNQRGEYGEQVIATLAKKLSESFGQGWGKRHLWHCVRTADIFQDDKIVNALSSQLSWTHFREISAIEDNLKREFYTEMAVRERWSTRTLQDRIAGMLFERTAISKKPEGLIRKELKLLREEGVVTPDLVFRDPYVLDFLGLKDTYSESDLETAILRHLQNFIVEMGSDFAFISRQKRILIDKEDYKIDLLFYHRGLRRLIAIDLKLHRFEAGHKSKMELYLNWLNKYERKEGEEQPIGLILCSEKQPEQIELLELNKGHIRVAEYLLQLPPKQLLREKLQTAIKLAKAGTKGR